MLLAVDLGLRTGLALYGRDGTLLWYRSSNFGSRERLRRAVGSILRETSEVSVVALEGSGDIAVPWIREIERLGLQWLQLSAEEWRQELLLPRQQRTGSIAKQTADSMARRVIEYSKAKRPTSLRHDAAEAILIGLWAVRKVGWIENFPEVIFS